MVKGHEWSYVHELHAEKNTSQLKCKSCGHKSMVTRLESKSICFESLAMWKSVQQCQKIFMLDIRYSCKAELFIAAKKKGGVSKEVPVDVETVVGNEEIEHVFTQVNESTLLDGNT
ncbi:hypothetical protein GOP47_0029584 [Adiantum capillus-veneris]|nr:hypothetical protein GOP47_0029584 [Adiantum capillus-veneris]